MNPKPEPQPKAAPAKKAKAKPVIDVLPFLEELEVSNEVREKLSMNLRGKGLQDPLKSSKILGQNLFEVLRDVYLEVDSTGDFSSFIAVYQRAGI